MDPRARHERIKTSVRTISFVSGVRGTYRIRAHHRLRTQDFPVYFAGFLSYGRRNRALNPSVASVLDLIDNSNDLEGNAEKNDNDEERRNICKAYKSKDDKADEQEHLYDEIMSW